jgi:hypothetical protein
MKFRAYQLPILRNNSPGVLVLHWARQTGKSFILAAWAVLRIFDDPTRLDTILCFEFGQYYIKGVNFTSTEPISDRIKLEGRKQETARVTEIMATNLPACFEERSIKDLPSDPRLTADLLKPEKITSPGGSVSIAATRDEAGHADGFWSIALAVRAGKAPGPFRYQRVTLPRRRKGMIG